MTRLAIAAATALLAATASSARQPQPAAPRPQFRSSVQTVHLDVSVLDRNRRPVRGLTPADFSILEDGKPQSIAVFSAVDIPDATPPTAPWMRDVAPDVRSNEGIQDRRLFLIALDDSTIQADAAALNATREIARKVVDRLGPSDLAAVIFTRDSRNSQDYTADRGRLLAALDKFSVGFRDMGLFDAQTGKFLPGEDDYYFMNSVNVLDRAVELLSAVPDRRKTMVYIGQGVPVDLDILGPQAAGLDAAGGSSALAQAAVASRMKAQMNKVFLRARRGNVNVYTIDACGLRALGMPGGSNRPTCVPGLEIDFLKAVAANTGGRAVVDTNDFDPGVAAIFQENASYYLLGYRPVDPKPDGKFHRLEVRVNRPDVEVRTRSGYEAEKASVAAKREAEAAASPLGVALAGLLPKSDLPLQMSAVALPLPGRRESAVAVTVGVRQPIRQTSRPVVEHVDLLVSAFNVDGKAFGSRRLLADVTIRPGASGLAEYEVLSRIDLEPGRYQLRIAANVGSLSTSGSLYYDVDVPDVSKPAVSLSGIVLSAVPGPVVAPREALQQILPVVPTTRRMFTDGHQLIAFARLYQGGKGPLKPAPLTLALRNDRGTIVMERRQDVAVDQFTNARSADIRIDVPLARLAEGEYLLTFETMMGGTTARRDTRFRVGRQ